MTSGFGQSLTAWLSGRRASAMHRDAAFANMLSAASKNCGYQRSRRDGLSANLVGLDIIRARVRCALGGMAGYDAPSAAP